MLTSEQRMQGLFALIVAGARTRPEGIEDGDVVGLLQALSPHSEAVEDAVYKKFARKEGGYGLPVLLALVLHDSSSLARFLPVASQLSPDHQQELVCAVNSKGMNLLGLAAYNATALLVPEGTLMEFLGRLPATARAALLLPLILNTERCATRLLAHLRPAFLPGMFSLMNGLDVDALVQLCGRTDGQGQSLITQVAFYAFEHFEGLLGVIKPLDTSAQCDLLLPLFQNTARVYALYTTGKMDGILQAIAGLMGKHVASLLLREVRQGVTVEQVINGSLSPATRAQLVSLCASPSVSEGVPVTHGTSFATLWVSALPGSSHENADSAPHRHESVARAGQ